jgi:hypothetical protein
MSRTDIPRAYIEMILSSKPSKWHSCFPDDLRLERAPSIPRHLDVAGATVGAQRLASLAVAQISSRLRRLLAALVAEVMRQLCVIARPINSPSAA